MARILRALSDLISLALQPLDRLGAWQAVVVLIAGAGAVSALAKYLDGRAGATVGLAIFALLLLIAGVRLQLRLAAGPRIRFVWIGGYTATSVLAAHLSSGHRMISPSPKIELVGVEVVNDPEGRQPEATVRDATVELSFFPDGDGPPQADDSPILISDGRWADNDQLLTRGPFERTDDIYRRDLPPGGLHHRIDIALREQGDPGLYAGSNRVWRAPRDPGLRLPDRAHRVRVTVRGTGLRRDAECWLRVSNPPAGPLNIELLSPGKTEPDRRSVIPDTDPGIATQKEIGSR